MTQAVGVRPGSVTAAQVIIRVLAVLGALGAAATLVFGILGLVSGATVAANYAGTESSGLGTAFGGLIGMFSGVLIFSGLVSAAFVALWFWIASALGRASKGARITATVLCGLDIAWGLLMVVLAASEREAVVVLPALVLLAIPGTLIFLLWGSENARRFFDAVAVPMPGAYYAPAPMSPPVGFVAPQEQDAVTTRFTVPPSCRTCRSGLQPGWTHCGRCGAPVQPGRPVGA
ncbi:hypothetical protein LQ327_22770 [Actinomycetospora endophytica]|uniref:Uncharacterized protein n=1 Tax=Actinomycetospora endophytica TaxID=2291215 RepID=A0ABS8PD66_9PSEU|nr:hypothetical protein [Actinomycetospora endophytica]MCD2196201.1 hypothetical protein [Actinomycetospora endophytica]